MFKLHDKVVYLRGNGIYEVEKISTEDFGLGQQVYLTLSPISNLKNKKLLAAYVLQSNASTFLRPIMKKEEVLELIDSFDTLEDLWFSDAKVRRAKYDEIYKTGDMKKICQIVRSIYLHTTVLNDTKKTINNSDKEYLNRINDDIFDEFSIALGISFSEVQKFIEERINIK